MRHPHQPIVYNDSEVVRGVAVRPQQYLVADDVGVKTNLSAHQIREHNLAILWCAEAHRRSFTSAAMLGDDVIGTGEGPSKKASEQAAAQEALLRVDREGRLCT